jgi:FkbM family methyltransferase
MPMVSYAQNGEDVVLNRVFAGTRRGFYVDIGANYPSECSVTRHFYDHGWSGINIEPVAGAFRELQVARPRDTNLNIGLASAPAQARFFEAQNASMLSTFCPEEAEAHRKLRGIIFEERLVPVMTLAQVCEQHVRGTIDFMSIDVENHEREVISGGDWKRWRPRLVLVEDFIDNEGVPTRARWEPLLLAADYHFGLFDGINRFYVRGEDKALLSRLKAPANAQDDYVHHRWSDEIQSLREQLAVAQARLQHALSHSSGVESETFDPPYEELRIAERWRTLSQQHPRLANVVRKTFRVFDRASARVRKAS